MRRFLFPLVVLIIVLSSCAPVRDRRTLNDMEALMSERPDSALAVLRGLQPRDLPGLHVRPLHALILSEALDKNYIDLTDDSLAMAANKYYGDHGTKLHRLKSWYYLGRIRFNAGNYAEAVICYNKALEYAESLTNYHYMGLINREIANAYSKVWDVYHTTEKLRESIEDFKLANEERYTAYSELALVSGLLKLKQFDEARQVLDEIDNPNDPYLSASVFLKRAQLAFNEGSNNYDEILSNYHSAEIGRIIPLTVNRFSEQAIVHQMAGNADSADFYMDLARQVIKTRGDSVVFEYDRSYIESLRGNYNSAYELLSHSFHSQDSSVYAALNQSISNYQGHYYQNEVRINALKAKNRFLIYGILILVLSLFVFCLMVRNKRQKEQIIEEMARTDEVRQVFSAMKNEKENLNQALAVLFENRLRILQTLSDQYSMLEDKHQGKVKENGRELFKDEIVASFKAKMKDLRGDKDISMSMEETLNAWKDGIMRRFRSVFGADSSSGIRMTEEDFKLVPYYFSGMKQKTISYLTNHTEHSIKERKRRIKQKIEALDSSFSKEKRLFLDNL